MTDLEHRVLASLVGCSRLRDAVVEEVSTQAQMLPNEIAGVGERLVRAGFVQQRYAGGSRRRALIWELPPRPTTVAECKEEVIAYARACAEVDEVAERLEAAFGEVDVGPVTKIARDHDAGAGSSG